MNHYHSEDGLALIARTFDYTQQHLTQTERYLGGYNFDLLNLNGQTLIGHELAFLDGDAVIYVHLPAINTLEVMID